MRGAYPIPGQSYKKNLSTQKIVIDANVDESEEKAAVKILAAVNVNIPLILQPVTPIGNAESPHMDNMIKLQKIYQDLIRDVRIIPQIHRCIGIN